LKERYKYSLGIPQRFRRIIGSIEEKLIPSSYLENEKVEWEEQLFAALNGEFDNNEEVIVDATEELEKFNKALARRSGSNVYTVKFRYFNDPDDKTKSVEGTMSVIGKSEEAATAKVEQDHVGLVVMEFALEA
jgi:hypothetical protein